MTKPFVSETGEQPTLRSYEFAQKIPVEAEVRPGVVIAKMPPEYLHGNTELPRELWEQFYGHEEIQQLFKDLLPTPSSKLTIKGSSVSNMAFSTWALDKNTGMVPPECRSDADIMLYDEEQHAALEKYRSKLEQHKMSVCGTFGDTKFEVVDADSLLATIQMDVDTLTKYPERFPPEMQNRVRGLYTTAQIVSLIPKDDTTVIIRRYGEAPPNDVWDILPKGIEIVPGTLPSMQNLEKEDIMVWATYYDHEMLTITVTKDENDQLHMHLTDPALVLEQTDIRDRLEVMHPLFLLSPVYFENPNPLSIQSSLIEGMYFFEDLEFESTSTPVWAMQAIPREIVMACEQGIEISADGDNTPYHWYTWGIAHRAAKGEHIFHTRNPDKSAEQVNNEFLLKFMEATARGCAQNAPKALEYFLLNYPMAELISPDIELQLRDYYVHFKPNTVLTQNLRYDNYDFFVTRLIRTDMEFERVQTPQGYTIPDIPGLRSFYDFCAKYDTEYGAVIGPAIEINTEADQPVGMPTLLHRTSPKSMSEVFGLLVQSFGWDSKKDIDKIEELVKNWKPTGTVKSAWGHTGNTFDMTANSLDIIKWMDYFSEKYPKEEANE